MSLTDRRSARNSTLAVLAIIVFLGLVLRILSVVLNLYNFRLYGDANSYFLMSHQWEGEGIYGYMTGMKSGRPNAYVTPGYPLILSAAYALVHDGYKQITLVRLFQAFIGACAPLLAFLFVRRITVRDGVALLTAFFVAFYPTYIESTVFLLTETSALTSMLLYLYLTAAGLQERKAHLNCLAGAAFAVHILIRPALLPLFILPFLYAVLSSYGRDRRGLLKVFVQTVLGFTAVMLPWWIRNFITFNSIIITATGSGNPLLGGTYPYMKDLFGDASKEVMSSSSLQTQLAIKRLVNGMTTEPLLYIKWYTIGKLEVMFGKPWLFMHMLYKEPWSYVHLPFHEIFYVVFHYLFVFVGFLGMLINSVTHKVSRYVSFYTLVFIGLYLVFIPVNRYAYQLMFFLIFASAFFICTAVDFFRQKQDRSE